MAPRRGGPSQPDLQTLDFNESLAMKPGRPVPVQTLLRRLQVLHEELASMEQGVVDKQSLITTAKELCNTSLLQHKHKGVRAFVACCLADMLKLHAPDAPYTVNQLREIFEFFIKELNGLKEKEDSHYDQIYYLLESLSTIKSIVLMADLPNADFLIVKIFTNFFELVGHDLHPRAEYHVADILIQLVEEVNVLPAEVVDIMLAQVKRASPAAILASPASKKKSGMLADKDKKKGSDQQTIVPPSQFPPAYNTTKRICNKLPEKMSRHICQYFSDVIFEASPSKDTVDGEVPEPSAEDIEELDKAHVLMQELYFAVPDVLLNVVPLLEQEMVSENLHMRLLSTSAVGAMATFGAFPTWSPTTWKAYLGRALDKSPIIRAKWIETACEILAARVDVTDTLRPMIKTKLVDNDEKVRLAAVRGIGELDWINITTKLSNGENEEVLLTLADRAKDKKFAVRSEGIKVLAKLWSSAYEVFLSGNSVVLDQLHWIPTRIFDVMYINDPETNIVIDQVVHHYLLPLPDPKDLQANKKGKKEKAAAETQEPTAPATESQTPGRTRGGARKGKEKESQATAAATTQTQPQAENGNGNGNGNDNSVESEDAAKTDRMLTLINALDQKAKMAFYSIPQNQSYYSKLMEVFLKLCEEYNGGVMEDDAEGITAKLHQVVHTLAAKFGEVDRMESDLMKFAKKHDRRSYELLRKCISPESDYITVVTSINDISKRMTASTNLSGQATTLMDTLMPLLFRSSLLIFNKSFVPIVMEISRTEKGPRKALGATAQEFIKEMSQSHPGVFKAHVKKLCELLEENAPTKDSYDAMTDKGVNVVDTIKACSGFASKFPADMPQHKKMMDALVNFALYGNSATAAKHAVSIIMATSKRKEMYATDLIKLILKEWEFGSEHSIARLGALSQLMLRFAAETEVEPEKIDRIVNDICIKDILFKVRTQHDDDEDWDGESEPDDECKAKVLALKVIVNRLRNHASDEDGDEARKTIAEPVFKILSAIIVKEGELTKKEATPRPHRSILRLSAAKMVLKLGRLPNYEKLISHHMFTRLALMAQDPSFVVRQRFIDAVKKHLVDGQLPPRYYTITFMMAHEPESELRDETMTWIKAKAKQMRERKSTTLETVFPRFIHLLAHHPDFGFEKDDLTDFVGFILYYLRSVATEDNLPMLFHIAQRMKTVRDGMNVEMSDNLYCLSEIAQNVIQKYEDIHGWSMQTWPGTVRMPAGLFLGMPDVATSHQVNLKSYMPADMKDVIASMVTRENATRKRKSLGPSRSEFATPAKKRSKTTKTPGATTVKSKSSSSSTKKSAKKQRESIDTPLKERRKSGRITKEINYDDSEAEDDDDNQMEWETEKASKGKKRAAEEEEEEQSEEEEEVEVEDEQQEEEPEDEAEEEAEEEEEEPKQKKTKGKGKQPAKATTTTASTTKGKKAAKTAAAAAEPTTAKSTRSTRATRGAKTNGAKAVITQKDDGESDDDDDEL